MNTKHQQLISSFAGLTILLVTGCANQVNPNPSSSQTSQVSPTQELNLYTSRHYDSDGTLYEEFTQKTGIKINIIEGKESELIERIKSEGANSPADILITVDAGNLWRAQQQNIFQPISSPVLKAAIPDNLRDNDGHWFALTKRARIMIYNKDKVKTSDLSTYEALAKPQWKGRVCVRSSGNIYNQSLVAAKIAELGEQKTEEWLKGLVANLAREPEGNDTAQIKAVAAGECDVALVNNYYVARMMRSQEPQEQTIVGKIGVFFPNQQEGGTHVNVSGGGVVINAPHKDNAIKFLEFLTTPEAQKVFAEGNNEYPVIKGVEENATLKSLGDFKDSGINVEVYGENNSKAIQLMDKVGWK